MRQVLQTCCKPVAVGGEELVDPLKAVPLPLSQRAKSGSGAGAVEQAWPAAGFGYRFSIIGEGR